MKNKLKVTKIEDNQVEYASLTYFKDFSTKNTHGQKVIFYGEEEIYGLYKPTMMTKLRVKLFNFLFKGIVHIELRE